MTNRIALGLALLIGALVLADVLLNESRAFLFLARRLLRLLELVAFWR